ncbi:MAG: hypothetical protein AAF806_22770 [Bacteroidota bacterium]
MKSFRNWTRQEIADTFGLDTKSNCKDLEKWLHVDENLIAQEDKAELERLREKLRENVDIWNEQELIIKFIALIIDMVDYDTEEFKSFANRKLKGKIDGEEISGEVDLMIASGKFEPKNPYFCLHEYKKEKGVDNDPLGQLIIAMMTAQELNNNNHPIYGAYVMGRNWFFLTLEGRKYCISDEYVATRDDIFKIFGILDNLKFIIQEISQERIGTRASTGKEQ